MRVQRTRTKQFTRRVIIQSTIKRTRVEIAIALRTFRIPGALLLTERVNAVGCFVRVRLIVDWIITTTLGHPKSTQCNFNSCSTVRSIINWIVVFKLTELGGFFHLINHHS